VGRLRRAGRRLLALAALGVLATIGIAAWRMADREPRLLDRATVIADTSDWDSMRQEYYWWITDDRLLFTRGNPRQSWQTGYTLYDMDARLGRERYLNAASNATDVSFGHGSEMEVSPDGKRLFWTDDDRGYFYTCDLNDGGPVRYVRSNESQIHWMADSEHLYEAVFDEALHRFVDGRIFWVRGDHRPRRVGLPASSPVAGARYTVTRNDQLVTIDWTGLTTNSTAASTEVYAAPIGPNAGKGTGSASPWPFRP